MIKAATVNRLVNNRKRFSRNSIDGIIVNRVNNQAEVCLFLRDTKCLQAEFSQNYTQKFSKYLLEVFKLSDCESFVIISKL